MPRSGSGCRRRRSRFDVETCVTVPGRAVVTGEAMSAVRIRQCHSRSGRWTMTFERRAGRSVPRLGAVEHRFLGSAPAPRRHRSSSLPVAEASVFGSVGEEARIAPVLASRRHNGTLVVTERAAARRMEAQCRSTPPPGAFRPSGGCAGCPSRRERPAPASLDAGCPVVSSLRPIRRGDLTVDACVAIESSSEFRGSDRRFSTMMGPAVDSRRGGSCARYAGLR